ncbi:MAG: PAS domain S-box protein [Thermodesulfobacteriota bacterium]|nr:PAS domain S-box protein [Thermodesulfobacteriota bacterium]
MTKKNLIGEREKPGKGVDRTGILEGHQGKKDGKLYSNFFDESRDAIVIAGRDGRFVAFNKSALDLIGYTREEMMGMDVDSLCTNPEDIKRFIREIRDKGAVADFDIRLRKKNEKVMDCLVNMTVRKSEEGKFIGYQGIIRDITVQKQTENLYNSFANSTQTGVYIVQNKRFKFINPHVLNYSQYYTMEDLIDTDPIDMVYPEDREATRENAIKMLKGERKAPYEFRLIAKDGSMKWIMETVTPIEYYGERAVMGNSMDVTVERETRAKVEEMKIIESTILDAIPHAVIGLENRRIIFANNSVEDVFGWKPEEIIGKLTRIFYRSDKGYDEIARRVYPALEKQNTHSEEFPCVRRDGTEIVCMVNTSKVGDILKDKRIVVVYEDVTERKRAQGELKLSFERVQKRLEETVNALASMTEKRDPYTAGHQQRVAQLAGAIAREMKLPDEQVEGILVAATLHDIGKIYEPSEILSKPGILTDIEFLMMKVHPRIGYDILKNIEFPWPVAKIVLQHHEKLDGSGYPEGLSDGDILLEARVLAVADVVEAMASHRPYRAALGIESALKDISENRGILYDPDAVDSCLRLFKEERFEFKFQPYTELRLNFGS